MFMPIELTPEERDELMLERKALIMAIASGTKRVEYADKRVEYRSQKEMQAALEFIDDQLGIKEPVPNKRFYASYSSGIKKGPCSNRFRWH